MKKKKALYIVIVTFALLVIIFGSLLIYNNYLEANNKENADISKKEESDIQKDLAKEDVKLIIDKYVNYIGVYDLFNRYASLTESTKISMVVEHIKQIKKLTTYPCTKLYEDGKLGIVLDDNTVAYCKDDEVVSVMSYDLVNSVYKKLFGKAEKISKKDYRGIYFSLDYNKDLNAFIVLETTHSNDFNSKSIYGIKDFTVNKNELNVKVGYIKFREKSNYFIADFDSSLKFTQEEIEKEGLAQQLVDQYADKIETVEVVFEWEKDHYVLKKINTKHSIVEEEKPKQDNDNEIVIKKEVDKTSALQLIEQYFWIGEISQMFETNEKKLSEEQRMYISMKYAIKDETKLNTYSCLKLYPELLNDEKQSYMITIDDGYEGFCEKNLALTAIPYQVANQVYQYLFGNNLEIPRKDFHYGIQPYDYLEKSDEFVWLIAQGGYSTGPEVYGIKDINLNKNILSIKLARVKLEYIEEENYVIPDFNSNLKFTDVERMEEGFGQKLVDQYNEQIDAKESIMEFIFEWEEDHYILKNIQ